MVELLELTVVCGDDPRMVIRSYAGHNFEDDDLIPNYTYFTDALADGWQVVSVLPKFEYAQDPFQTFWLQRVRGPLPTGWTNCWDEEDPRYAIPTDERNVLVMLNGTVDLTDFEGRHCEPHGIHFGWFEHDKGFWRVNGKRDNSQWVTHWHEIPLNPIIRK